ncbi:MAG TPA: hypothetical protein VNT54_15765, partial [Solirubrobacteraceae bacterium]|nr:hypothetical protein [Solirubrobacteraceae bacterium]
FEQRQERERARWRLFLVRKRSSLKHRVHAQLLAFGHTCPVSDLFGRQGRELLERLDFPEPWRGGVLASVSSSTEKCWLIGIEKCRWVGPVQAVASCATGCLRASRRPLSL